VCIKGRITCTECEGKGSKECDYCGGKGFIYTEKPRTTVTASFGTGFYGRRYHPRYHPGTQVYSKDGIIVVKPYPYYYPPCNGGSYFSIGREEEVVKELCPKCHGTGTLRCPRTIQCTTCKGVGYFIETCKTCNGSKQLTCTACEGRGYKGSPQVMPEKTESVEEAQEEVEEEKEDSPEEQSDMNTPAAIP
jgi:DnaJ-class molecular chaperone